MKCIVSVKENMTRYIDKAWLKWHWIFLKIILYYIEKACLKRHCKTLNPTAILNLTQVDHYSECYEIWFSSVCLNPVSWDVFFKPSKSLFPSCVHGILLRVRKVTVVRLYTVTELTQLLLPGHASLPLRMGSPPGSIHCRNRSHDVYKKRGVQINNVYKLTPSADRRLPATKIRLFSHGWRYLGSDSKDGAV